MIFFWKIIEKLEHLNAKTQAEIDTTTLQFLGTFLIQKDIKERDCHV